MIWAAFLYTVGYLVFISLEICLSGIVYSGMEASASKSYVRKYRQFAHFMWFGMYALLMSAVFKLLGDLEQRFALFGLVIIGIVRLLWIQEPKGQDSNVRDKQEP